MVICDRSGCVLTSDELFGWLICHYLRLFSFYLHHRWRWFAAAIANISLGTWLCSSSFLFCWHCRRGREILLFQLFVFYWKWGCQLINMHLVNLFVGEKWIRGERQFMLDWFYWYIYLKQQLAWLQKNDSPWLYTICSKHPQIHCTKLKNTQQERKNSLAFPSYSGSGNGNGRAC